MTSIAAALHDLLNEQELPLTEAIARHFSDDYRQRTDGNWDDIEGFTAHIAYLRKLARRAEVDVLDEFVDGRRYADRHVVSVEKRDGSCVVQEVYLFGELDRDGRFRRIEETTLLLSGDEADRPLGSAR